MRSTTACLRASLLVTLLVGVSIGSLSLAVVAQDTAAMPSEEMRIVLQPDGSAEWTVRLHFELADANESTAFDRLAEEYRAMETDVLSPAPFEEAAARSSAVNDREMAIQNPARSADRGEGRGTIELSFTWTNFVRTEGDRLELGDVFRTRSGTWLPGLEPGQVLIIEFPANYSVESSSHPLQNGTFHFDGPQTFEPGHPSATLVERDGTTTPGDDRLFSFGPFLGLDPVGWILVVLLVGVVIGGVVFAARRRGVFPPGGLQPSPGSAAADPEGDDPADQPLLSDEERVLNLLRQHDGRMKQAAIVEATDWSNAKVSQLLTEMAERDAVEKLRIGRENLISLPDETD